MLAAFCRITVTNTFSDKSACVWIMRIAIIKTEFGKKLENEILLIKIDMIQQRLTYKKP